MYVVFVYRVVSLSTHSYTLRWESYCAAEYFYLSNAFGLVTLKRNPGESPRRIPNTAALNVIKTLARRMGNWTKRNVYIIGPAASHQRANGPQAVRTGSSSSCSNAPAIHDTMGTRNFSLLSRIDWSGWIEGWMVGNGDE